MILAKEYEGELWIKASLHNREVKRAVEAEREACAKIVEMPWQGHYREVAAQIRARGQR